MLQVLILLKSNLSYFDSKTITMSKQTYVLILIGFYLRKYILVAKGRILELS